MDPLRSEICWSNFKYFKYFLITLIVSANYIFVRLLDYCILIILSLHLDTSCFVLDVAAHEV